MARHLEPGSPPELDPWKHRSKGMRCVTCMYYVPKEPAGQGHSVLGRCRRHAPTMNGYPVVFPHDWCGDHKLNEELTAGSYTYANPNKEEE